MTEDMWNTHSGKQFVELVVKDMFPEMKASTVVAALVPANPDIGDVKLWVEIGCSIMMDKPILAILQHGTKPSRKLTLVADIILEMEPDGMNAEFAQQLKDAIARLEKLKK